MSYTEEYSQALARCAPGTGEEFDWYALDIKGRLAILTTAGLGPVPESIWSHRNEMNDLSAAIENLPDVTSHERVFVGEGNYMEWYDYVWKGLFAFDYGDVHRANARLWRYDLIARPRESIQARVLLPHTDLHWLPILNIDFEACKWLSDLQVKSA